MNNTKKGAASFYVVAFSTLILLIIVASFTALVIAQITRSSNADLSQSAYDSALAGVEDAKVAFYSYQSCLSQGAVAVAPDNDGTLNCNEIVYVVEETNSCDMVSYILGRAPYNPDSSPDVGTEVLIEESNKTGNNMSQAYTCTKLQTELNDYRVTLTSNMQMKVVRPVFDGIESKRIKTVTVSWGSSLGQTQLNYSNFANGGVVFKSSGLNIANPPTLSFALLQTGAEFKMQDFDLTKDGKTDRAMLYLVPSDNANAAKIANTDTYHGTYNETNDKNFVSKNALLKSNNRVSENLPYVVYCNPENAISSEFVCSATIELPEPIGGERNDDNFVVIIGIPYGKPATEVALEFFCADGDECGTMNVGPDETEGTNQATLKGVQIGVDSTGRANDLFRRVETRLEGNSDSMLSIMGPLELGTDNKNSDDLLLKKMQNVICEYPPFVDNPTCQ